MKEQRLIYKEKCETCGGLGQVGDLFADETIPFAQGKECPDCGGKGYTLINQIGICPNCEGHMIHYRLRGYVCPYCEKDRP